MSFPPILQRNQAAGKFDPLRSELIFTYLKDHPRQTTAAFVEIMPISIPWLWITAILMVIGVILVLLTPARNPTRNGSGLVTVKITPVQVAADFNPSALVMVNQTFLASLSHPALAIGPLISSADKPCDGYPYSVAGSVKRMILFPDSGAKYIGIGQPDREQVDFYAALSTGDESVAVTRCKTAIALLPPKLSGISPDQLEMGKGVTLVLVDDDADLTFDAHGVPIVAYIASPP